MYNVKVEIEKFQKEFNYLKNLIEQNVKIDGKVIEKSKIDYISNNTQECIKKMNILVSSLNK